MSQIHRVNKRLEREKGTLNTIVHIRGKAGALFGVISSKDKVY